MNYVCECAGGHPDHDVFSNTEWEFLYDVAKSMIEENSILNKDCPYEPYSSFSIDTILLETEHMFLIRRT